jgi:phosphate transport system substrate-binding protein
MKVSHLIYSLLFIASICGCAFQPEEQDGKPSSATIYIENKGSDTMVNLALAWAEAYQGIQPEVQISVTGGGSGTGIAALINNTVDIANASRQIKVVFRQRKRAERILS